MDEILYDVEFDLQIERVSEELSRWFAGPRKKLPDLEQFGEPVYLKSSSDTVIHANTAYHDFFSNGMAAAGRLASSFLHNSVIRVSEMSDSLLLSGADHLVFEHHCIGPRNRWNKVRTFKKSLLDHQDAAYDILGLSRPIARESIAMIASDKTRTQASYLRYQQMDTAEKRICSLIAEGKSTKEIAKALGVTPKTIENRRRKILCQFEFEQPIEIVKTMVRFEERGLTL